MGLKPTDMNTGKLINISSSQLLAFAFSMLFLLLGCSRLTANDTKPADFRTTVDGPYVFYKGDKIVVRNFMISANLCQMEEEVFEADDFISLYCKIDPAGQIGFKFPLRKEHKPARSVYPEVDKLFAISDIEGNFSAFASTLKSNGVIDDRFRWNFGDGHLVLVGDFFDRGEHVTAVLWLIYKLEEEAKRAGGQVHFIIGNHEEMNMRGDERFAVTKYKRVAEKMEVPIRDLYEKNTELGRWLRTKNVVVKIGNTLFTHGGISPAFSKNGLSLEKTNQIAQQFMGESFRLIELQSNNKNTPMVFAKDGPLWYRGYFKEKMSNTDMQRVLDAYQAEHIVVGHTIVEEITPLYEGRLIPIDVKHATQVKTKGFNAILKTGPKTFYRVNVKGDREEMVVVVEEEVPVFADQDIEIAPDADLSIPEEGVGVDVVPVKETVPPKKKPVRREEANEGIPLVLKAIDEGDLIVLKGYLYDHDIDAPFEGEKFTLLHFAIGRSRLDIVKFLLEEDADPDILYQDKTAMMYAVKNGETAIVKYLVDLGVSVKVKNRRAKTSLHYAAQYSTPEIVKLLLENGAKATDQDVSGKTPLMIAEDKKNIPVAMFLKGL